MHKFIYESATKLKTFQRGPERKMEKHLFFFAVFFD